MKMNLFFCVLSICVFTLCSSHVSGDEFEDFIQSCTLISRNYKSAAYARKSRFAKEYQMYMKTMRSQASAVQRCIEDLGLGRDFQFRILCSELDKIFQEDKNARFGKNNRISGDPDGLLRILLFDVRELHKMKFTTEDGGRIKLTLERKRRLLEMTRLARFFRQFRKRALSNKDVSLEQVFAARCRRMQTLAKELTILFRRKHPSASTQNSLEREVDMLLRDHTLILDNAKRKNPKRSSTSRNRRYRSRNRNKGHSISRLREDQSPKALEQNTRIALRNIDNILAQWERMNFLTDPSIKHSSLSGSSGGNDDVRSILKTEHKDSKDYASMSTQELNGELLKLRQQIIKGNTSMDGFDPVSERKYVQTLTKDQKKIYQTALKKNKDQGYESVIAVRSAVLKTQFEISMKKELPSKKELVRILEKIRKDQIRSRGKINF